MKERIQTFSFFQLSFPCPISFFSFLVSSSAGVKFLHCVAHFEERMFHMGDHKEGVVCKNAHVRVYMLFSYLIEEDMKEGILDSHDPARAILSPDIFHFSCGHFKLLLLLPTTVLGTYTGAAPTFDVFSVLASSKCQNKLPGKETQCDLYSSCDQWRWMFYKQHPGLLLSGYNQTTHNPRDPIEKQKTDEARRGHIVTG